MQSLVQKKARSFKNLQKDQRTEVVRMCRRTRLEIDKQEPDQSQGTGVSVNGFGIHLKQKEGHQVRIT